MGEGAADALARAGLGLGAEVVAVSRFFGYASQVVVPVHQLVPLPRGFTMAEGAAFPVAGLTAWYALHHLARARAGERVLVHSAAGGVGQVLVQLAVASGCRVLELPERREKSPQFRHRSEGVLCAVLFETA